MGRAFKYEPEDFGELPVQVIHMDLTFDVHDKHTKVLSHMKLKARVNLDELALDAKRLEILKVECKSAPCTFDYQEKKDKLIIKFKEKVHEGTVIIITTETICHPTKNILEGLYYDDTPKGAPPTQITQCQQWGFQRLVPCIDDMTAKCTYATRIIANKRYTDIISNGDLAEERKSVGDDRVEVLYLNMKTPMAPYLFFLGVGTYETHSMTFEYPDTDTFRLELLVPPGSDKDRAEQALEIIHDCVMWVHLFTGPDTYLNNGKSKEIWELLKKRDEPGVRDKIKHIASGLRLGYKYTGTVYREIAMQNSDYGGMENVGNTTITSNRIMPFEHMADVHFEYMIKVKVHEYYHNLNGSEVTGWSPFELWLNEAVTVHIERDYSSFLQGKDYERLETFLTLIAPHHGTFIQDAGPASLPIEPDGFNDTTELVSSVTYVKAPEFVRMIETLMGKGSFVRGLDLFHTRYKHGNATRVQWLDCMEEASGLDFTRMAEVWLKQTSYPILHVKRSYENGKLTLHLRQSGFRKGTHWEFPFCVAMFSGDGKKLAEATVRISKVEDELSFEIPKPAFISLNRRLSFYGKVECDSTEEEMLLKVKYDDDIINRYLAYKKLMDAEKIRIMKDPSVRVNETVVDLFYSLISDQKLMSKVGSLVLTIFESVEDDAYAHRYKSLYAAKRKILIAIATRYKTELLALYHHYDGKTYEGSSTDKRLASIKDRRVKNTALSVLATLDTPDIHQMIKEQFLGATNGSDELISFQLYLKSSMKDKMEMLMRYESECAGHPVSWEGFLACVGGNDSEDALDIIKRVEKTKHFRIEQANDQRALFARFAVNKKVSLLTEDGRKFLQEKIIQLARVNEYNTGHILKSLSTINLVRKEYQPDLVQVLINILTELSPDETPSVYGMAKRILQGSPAAVAAYEEKNGKIPEF